VLVLVEPFLEKGKLEDKIVRIDEVFKMGVDDEIFVRFLKKTV
jgi:hypothetical protein